jgi:putative copper resistance protein D
LTVISIASFVGVWLTMSTHAAGTWPQAATRWLHLISFGFLIGGYMWKGLFAQPGEIPTQLPYFTRFTAASFALFRKLIRFALPVFVVTAIYDIFRFASWQVDSWLIWFEAILVVAITLTALYDIYRPTITDEPFRERTIARGLLGLLLLDSFAIAAFDVNLAQNGQAWPLLVRTIHLAAFGIWFGGAIWNIFITVPSARNIVSLPVVVAASQQLERFRISVRIILPTLIITGLIQAYPYVGLNPRALTTSLFGWLILTKLFLIVILVGVFITCPMWRACSPISGMCKIDDLYQQKV